MCALIVYIMLCYVVLYEDSAVYRDDIKSSIYVMNVCR